MLQKLNFSDNWPYLFWFLFYFLLFWLLLGANAVSFVILLVVYAISIVFAFSSVAEDLWRKVSGVRPLRLRKEKTRLLPLFKEAYLGAVKTNPDLPKSIKLYIQEDMNINAFAFGTSTLVLTRGSIELLNDDCLIGLMAHELGHFSHYDTVTALVASVGNLFMSLIIKCFAYIAQKFEKGNLLSKILVFPFFIIYAVLRGVEMIGELFLMKLSRKQEYMADAFALNSGFGEELTEVLLEIYSISVEKPQSVKEQLRSTHPNITLRIEQLEKRLYQ